MESALSNIKEFIQKLNDSELHFFCNYCLTKQNLETLPDFKFHDTGRCEDCGSVNEVSVPAINQKLREIFIWRNLDLNADHLLDTNIRSTIWSEKIGSLKNERLRGGHMKLA